MPLAKDPYTELGVSRTASADDIRKAFRALAKKYHPDRNPGNKQAEDRFKAVSSAFEIIGDDEKRKRFDRGEIDADGNERATMGAGGGFSGAAGNSARWRSRRTTADDVGGASFEDVQDILGEFFGQGGRQRRPRAQRGRDIRHRMTVDFLDAARGATKQVRLSDGRTIKVAIPEGLRDGQTMRLKGQGSPGVSGGPAGDLFVDMTVTPHPLLTVKGDDLSIDLPLTLKEAVLGAKVEVPTLTGTVVIKVPPGTSAGATFRLRERGLKDRKSGTAGDLFARAKIVLPKTDAALSAFVEGWEDPTPDPRSTLKL